MRRINLVVFTGFLALFARTASAKTHIPTSQVVAEIQDHLYHANVFKHGQVQASFSDGVTTLTGTVDSVGVKTDADRAARKQEDVLKVVNKIQVDPDDVGPAQIVEKARHKILTYYAYSIFDSIELEVRGHTLVVLGQVTQPYKKDDIGSFLAHTKGVIALENKIQVLPASIWDDSLRVRIARAIYNDPLFAGLADMANPPIHIIVDNGNVTLDGVVNSELARVKAANDADFAVTFFKLTNNLTVKG
jgi:osmotically-inducible protein OsmY